MKMSRNSESKFQVHLSSTKAMFQYMTYTSPLHGRLWIQVHSQIVSINLNPEFQKKMLERLVTKKLQEL